ncbi:MAG: osmotically inducible protein C [Saprospiraceae bacterium]|nr:MAG: osmotically inducible protein C [Saprospiraceae bacterium]
MHTQKVTFSNQQGIALSARLELPVNQLPHTYAIFAHCFTCNKNLQAVRNISRALNLKGIAVLRFDFTGLGESEGEFAETNFSTNVQDLVAAADYLEQHYQAPSLLVGHSLGGAAVIAASGRIKSVTAVATIAAPFNPAHVKHLFTGDLEHIVSQGEAEVNIGGRPFKVKKQFLEDVNEHNLNKVLNNMEDKAILILHSPQDKIVGIENATDIYKAARHPKSFVSLDGADHLLSDKADSVYAGELIGCWIKRYIEIPEKEPLKAEKSVAVRLGAEGFTTEIMVRKHGLVADEPESVGGNDFGPSPYELVAAGLGACTAMTVQMYARRKKWLVKEVIVNLDHYKDYAEDMQQVEDPKSKIDYFERVVEFVGDLSAEQRQRLLEIANKCPVHRTMEGEIEVKTRLKRENDFPMENSYS